MVLAAGLAILVRVNLPISVALVWVTNPLTMPPMFYFAYYVGVHLLGMPPVDFELSFSWEWLRSVMSTIGTPFLLVHRVFPGKAALIFRKKYSESRNP